MNRRGFVGRLVAGALGLLGIGAAKKGTYQAKCKRPPAGWWCSRTEGHEGPCAARPEADWPTNVGQSFDDYLKAWKKETDEAIANGCHYCGGKCNGTAGNGKEVFGVCEDCFRLYFRPLGA